MSKAKDIETALENSKATIAYLSYPPLIKTDEALTALRQARESVDLEQLREALQSANTYFTIAEPSSQAEAEAFESVRIIGQAAQTWLDFMEGEE